MDQGRSGRHSLLVSKPIASRSLGGTKHLEATLRRRPIRQQSSSLLTAGGATCDSSSCFSNDSCSSVVMVHTSTISGSRGE